MWGFGCIRARSENGPLSGPRSHTGRLAWCGTGRDGEGGADQAHACPARHAVSSQYQRSGDRRRRARGDAGSAARRHRGPRSGLRRQCRRAHVAAAPARHDGGRHADRRRGGTFPARRAAVLLGAVRAGGLRGGHRHARRARAAAGEPRRHHRVHGERGRCRRHGAGARLSGRRGRAHRAGPQPRPLRLRAAAGGRHRSAAASAGRPSRLDPLRGRLCGGCRRIALGRPDAGAGARHVGGHHHAPRHAAGRAGELSPHRRAHCRHLPGRRGGVGDQRRWCIRNGSSAPPS